MKNNTFIVLSGGSGGVKTTFIEEVLSDPQQGCIAVLPEAIFLMQHIQVQQELNFTGLSSRSHRSKT